MHINMYNWGEHERAPHRRPKYVKICMYVCMYVSMCVSLTQISLTPIATLYDNGFSGRVQNSPRAFNYTCGALALYSLRVRRNQTADSQVKAASALWHDVATSIAKA